jgi:hypothetical protein
VGCAEDAKDRFNSHENKPSCYILALAKAICQLNWSNGGDPIFKSHSFIVALVLEEEDAKVGELIITAISNSMHTPGCGFNIADCGNSNHSMKIADRTTLGRKNEHILNVGPFLKNVRMQDKLL